MGNSKSRRAHEEFFESCPFKSVLTDKAFKSLLSKFVEECFPPDTVLCTEGELCENLYLIRSGSVIVSLDNGSLPVTTCRDGDTVNAEGLLMDFAKVTAKTSDEVTAFTLDKKKWNNWVASNAQAVLILVPLLVPDPLVIFKGVSMFESALISPEHADHLKAITKVHAFKCQDVVYRECDIEDQQTANMFVFCHGSLQSSQKGSHVVICYGEQGDYFGEIALFMHTARRETVTATDKSIVYSISKEDLFGYLNQFPDARPSYINCLKKRLAKHFTSSKNQLFEGVSAEEIGPLLKGCEWEMCDKGRVIFNEGAIGDTFYILLFGELGVYVNKEGVSTLVNTMKPGQYFGEIALVTDKPRTATIICHTESVVLSMTKERFEDVFASAPEFLANFQIKLAPKNVELKHILYHAYGLECFVNQMKAEYSQENIMFWKECRSFQNLVNGSFRQRFTANRMYEEYIRDGAAMMVNLKGITKDALTADYYAGRVYTNMFNKSMEEIFHLMERDSFARFKSGPHFQAFLNKVGVFDEVANLAQTRTVVNTSPTARKKLGMVHSAPMRAVSSASFKAHITPISQSPLSGNARSDAAAKRVSNPAPATPTSPMSNRSKNISPSPLANDSRNGPAKRASHPAPATSSSPLSNNSRAMAASPLSNNSKNDGASKALLANTTDPLPAGDL